MPAQAAVEGNLQQVTDHGRHARERTTDRGHEAHLPLTARATTLETAHTNRFGSVLSHTRGTLYIAYI